MMRWRLEVRERGGGNRSKIQNSLLGFQVFSEGKQPLALLFTDAARWSSSSMPLSLPWFACLSVPLLAAVMAMS
jgi:hypothetical protein